MVIISNRMKHSLQNGKQERNGTLSNALLADDKENGGGFRGISIKTVWTVLPLDVNTTWIQFLLTNHQNAT